MGTAAIKRYSIAEITAMKERGDYVPTPSDAPTIEPDEEFWAKARLVLPSGKSSVHLRIDTDVLEWFKAQGRGHLTRMNAVLRSYAEVHKGGSKR